MTNKIVKDDVIEVASQLGLNPTPLQVEQVLEGYDEAQENDPSGTWNLVVESLLYNVMNDDLTDRK